MKNDLPISVLGLNARTYSALQLRGVLTVGHITRLTARRFVREHGRRSWRDVDFALTQLGVRFRPGPEPHEPE